MVRFRSGTHYVRHETDVFRTGLCHNHNSQEERKLRAKLNASDKGHVLSVQAWKKVIINYGLINVYLSVRDSMIGKIPRPQNMKKLLKMQSKQVHVLK